MHVLRAITIIVVVSLWAEVCPAQGLSTTILPSEDEIYQALSEGEIDYFQYLTLLEISRQGLDSTNLYLLDEIPNLAFFSADSRPLVSDLETEQTAPFVNETTTHRVRYGDVTCSYYQDLDDDSRNRYRLAANLDFGRGWSGKFKIHREYSGRERLVNRTVSYRNRHGTIRDLRIGSFNTRLGLGTVVGYRGKLLDYSDHLDSESFWFPDYGGFNGAYADAALGAMNATAVTSYNRDSTHSLLLAALMLSDQTGDFRPAVIIGATRLRNRVTGTDAADLKYAANWRFDYTRGYNTAEIAGQSGDDGFAPAAVIEGRHRLPQADVRYALWTYGDRYRDLTGGSKAAAIRHTEEIDALGFSFSDKRAGQEGGLVRTVVQLGRRWQLSNSLLLAARNKDTANAEILTGITRNWSKTLSTRIDYMARHRKRDAADGYDRNTDQRYRIETRFQSGYIKIRTYIAYTDTPDGSGYASVFGSMRYDAPAIGRLELWSNLGRIKSGEINYWYMYVRTQQDLVDGVTISLKLANVYRGAGDNDPVASIELKAAL